MPGCGIIPTHHSKLAASRIHRVFDKLSVLYRNSVKHLRSHPIYVATCIVCTSLVIHAVYLTRITAALPHTHQASNHGFEPILTAGAPNTPPLFIYRRTKKSGSSAMLDALIHTLKPYNYTPLYFTGSTMKAVVRAEGFSASPRRLLVAEHNTITREDYPLGHAIIADTVRDGYEQVTSFCRYVTKVKTCDQDMLECLNSEEAKSQNRYRWAGRQKEDADTYIDLPLSSAHPALSTTILRRVFPNVTLYIDNWNSANSKCPELPILRNEYFRLYSQLDQQVETLRKRMLVLAGYPFKDDSVLRGDVDEKYSISFDEMLSAAEAEERKKYDITDSAKKRYGFSDVHQSLISEIMVWSRGDNDSVTLTPGRRP